MGLPPLPGGPNVEKSAMGVRNQIFATRRDMRVLSFLKGNFPMARTLSETVIPAPKELSLPSSPVFKLLDGLSNRDRELVLAAATLRRVSANTAITRQGTPAVRLYMVVKGCARFFYDTSDGRKILLIWLAPGDLFGGAAMVQQSVNYCAAENGIAQTKRKSPGQLEYL